MNAQEMFKELNYELKRNEKNDIVYVNKMVGIVMFYANTYKFFNDGGFDTTIGLHQAIHQQMKELNWI